MADGEKRIIELEELTTLTDNDYIAVDNSATGGQTKKYKLKRLSDSITELAEDMEEAIDGVIEETDSKFEEALALGTASGSIASFTDGSTLPMKKLEVDIEPVQDLHGYENPWVGGSGKNKYEGSPSFDGYTNLSTWVKDTSTYNGHEVYKKSELWNGLFKFIYLPVGTYTFSVSAKADNAMQATLYLSGKDGTATTDPLYTRVNLTNSWQRFSGTFTVSTSGTIALRLEKSSNVDGYVYVSEYQVEQGSTATTFAPYSNICPISGWSSANVSVASKNLSKSQTNNSVLCSVKKGVTYTLSYEGNVGANIKKNTNSGEVVIWGPQLPLTFTADEDFNIYLNAWNANISNIQVEVGNQATAYEAYNGQTYTIDLDGTRYGGTLDVISGELVVDRVMTTFNGSEKWIYTSSLNRVYVNIPNAKKGASGRIVPIQSNLLHYSQENREDYGAHINDQGNLIVYAPNDIVDANTWKTWLASNNVQVVYELATPQTIQLTPTEVKSLLATNNVFADTGDILDATYVRNANITINDLIRRIEALENA